MSLRSLAKGLLSPAASLFGSAIVLPIFAIATTRAWIVGDQHAGMMIVVTLVLCTAPIASLAATRRERDGRERRTKLNRQLVLVQGYQQRQQAVVRRMQAGDEDAFTEFNRDYGERGRRRLVQELSRT